MKAKALKLIFGVILAAFAVMVSATGVIHLKMKDGSILHILGDSITLSKADNAQNGYSSMLVHCQDKVQNIPLCDIDSILGGGRNSIVGEYLLCPDTALNFNGALMYFTVYHSPGLDVSCKGWEKAFEFCYKLDQDGLPFSVFAIAAYEDKPKPRDYKLVFYNEGRKLSDTLTVKVTDKPLLESPYQIYGDLFHVSAEGDKIIIKKNFPVSLLGNTIIEPMREGDDMASLHVTETNAELIFEVDQNKKDEFRGWKLNFKPADSRLGDFINIYYNIVQVPSSFPTYQEIRNSFKDIYDNLHASSKVYATDLVSDKPIWQMLVNREEITTPWFRPYPYQLLLQNRDLSGTFPESLVKLMPLEIFLDGNYFYGKVPDAVVAHPHWSKNGWTTMQQNPVNQDPLTGETFEPWRVLDQSNVSFKLPNLATKDLLTGETIMTEDLFAKNKITEIRDFCYNGMATGLKIEDASINDFLGYRDKGFGYINNIWMADDYQGEYLDYWMNYAKHINEGGATGIKWSRGVVGEGTPSYDNYQYLNPGYYDKRGENLNHSLGELWYFDSEGYVKGYPIFLDLMPLSVWRQRILKPVLGEPLEHENFSDLYTSTDYSKDGEVVTLQKATEGKGIDIVLLGDGYVDRDMNDGGWYERDMRQAMELFFENEPYASLRNRFNVYAVRVVSKNEYNEDDSSFRIKNDNTVCVDYASKVSGINLDRVTIIEITKQIGDYLVMSGNADLFESGASISHIACGGPTHILVHEAGGHGLAKLADEYLFDDAVINEALNAEGREFILSKKAQGWYANIDVTNNPTEVSWARFISDPRYADEAGIYEGAWLWETGVYRPTATSIMRESNLTWFNAPSREAIYKTVMKWSEGDDWQYDYETFVEFDAPSRAEYVRRAKLNAPASKQAEKPIYFKHPQPKLQHAMPRIVGKSPKSLLETR